MDAGLIHRRRRLVSREFSLPDLAAFVQTYNDPPFTGTLTGSAPVVDGVLGPSYQYSFTLGGFGEVRIAVGLLGVVSLAEFDRIVVPIRNASVNDWCAAALYINDGVSQKISDWMGLAANGYGQIAPNALVVLDWTIVGLPELRTVADYGLLLHVTIGQGPGLADALEIVVGGAT